MRWQIASVVLQGFFLDRYFSIAAATFSYAFSCVDYCCRVHCTPFHQCAVVSMAKK